MADDIPQQWDFYLCHFNDGPASISVNMALARLAPDASRPWLCRAIVHLREPSNGLPSPEERPTLDEIEDAIIEAATRINRGLHVGRVFTQGIADVVFYAASPAGFEQTIGAAIRRFPAYSFNTDVAEEPDWGMYHNVLYPDRRSMQQILDRNLVHQIEQQGDDVAVPREVDHFIYFRDAFARSQFAQRAAQIGFATHEDDPNGVPRERGFGLRLVRRDAVEFHSIHQVVLELVDLADEFDGDYDGWGCVRVPKA